VSTKETRPARVVIESVVPEVDGGRFPIKRTVGEEVVVEADAFGDGHDRVACELLHRPEGEAAWICVPMEPLGNDRFRGTFRVERLGRHLYTVRARTDRFGTWSRDLEKRARAGQDLEVDFRIGAAIVAAAAERATARDAGVLADHAEQLGEGGESSRALALSRKLPP
jgi:starch synthase (maltosyl-transferring)